MTFPQSAKIHLSVQRLLDAYSSLYLALSSFNLRHDPLNVLQLVLSFPEHLGVSAHFFWSLAFHVLTDVVHVITTESLARLDKLVEFSLGPVGETLRANWAIQQSNVTLFIVL